MSDLPFQEHAPNREKSRYFRDALRAARAAVLRDAEAFTEIVIAIERLGSTVQPAAGGFGKLRERIHGFVMRSAFAQAAALDQHRLHTPFSALYELVRKGRNAAVHEGAYARHLAGKAIELSLLVEYALCQNMSDIGDYMVSGVITVAPWQPVSFARQTLLANSFSFLPIWLEYRDATDWYLISDAALVRYLRKRVPGKDEKTKMAKSLEAAIRSGELEPLKPFTCTPDVSVSDALERSGGLPVLVHGPQKEWLLGIATAFDLL